MAAGLVSLVLVVGVCQVAEQLGVSPVREQLAQELASLPSPSQSVIMQESSVARFGEAAVIIVYRTELTQAAVHEFYRAEMPRQGFLQHHHSEFPGEWLSCFLRGEDWLSVETTAESLHAFTVRLARWRSVCA